MDDEVGHSDSQPVSLQMLTQGRPAPQHDGEVEYSNV